MNIKEEIKERLNWFEKYYEKHSKEDNSFEPNFIAIQSMKEVLIRQTIEIADINRAVEIYNSTSSGNHHEGSGWFDLRLHLCHVSRIYGQELKINKQNQLVKAR